MFGGTNCPVNCFRANINILIFSIPILNLFETAVSPGYNYHEIFEVHQNAAQTAESVYSRLAKLMFLY